MRVTRDFVFTRAGNLIHSHSQSSANQRLPFSRKKTFSSSPVGQQMSTVNFRRYNLLILSQFQFVR